jgi:hypothetical protein
MIKKGSRLDAIFNEVERRVIKNEWGKDPKGEEKANKAALLRRCRRRAKGW